MHRMSLPNVMMSYIRGKAYKDVNQEDRHNIREGVFLEAWLMWSTSLSLFNFRAARSRMKDSL